MMKILTTAALLAAVTFGGTACEGLDSSGGKTHAEKVVAQQQKANKKDKQPAGDSSKPAAKPTPHYTTAQEQAIGSASDYLDTASFSRSGLIDQLKYEGFNTKDATFGVDHIKVNWFHQAEGSAKDYLDTSSFSRSGLIEQLRYEGFTPAQAAYGVNHVGL